MPDDPPFPLLSLPSCQAHNSKALDVVIQLADTTTAREIKAGDKKPTHACRVVVEDPDGTKHFCNTLIKLTRQAAKAGAHVGSFVTTKAVAHLKEAHPLHANTAAYLQKEVKKLKSMTAALDKHNSGGAPAPPALERSGTIKEMLKAQMDSESKDMLDVLSMQVFV